LPSHCRTRRGWLCSRRESGDRSTDFVKSSYKQDRSTEATLWLLRELESGDAGSQRKLASKQGVALGLTNAIIKRAVNKGLVKVSEAPARRFAYYLTPKGFSEKARLVSEYLSISLNFFRRARSEYEDALVQCHQSGWKRIVLVGSGELAEIAIISALDGDVEIAGIIDAEHNAPTFCGLKVISSIDAAGEVDAYIITDSNAPQPVFDQLVKTVTPERILTPPSLHVARGRNYGAGEIGE